MTMTPVYSMEAEKFVLGSILLDMDNRRFDAVRCITPRLEAEHFYRYEHRAIFLVICELRDIGKPVDAIHVFYALQQIGMGDECGGLPYLLELVNHFQVGGVYDIVTDANIIIERAQWRKDLLTPLHWPDLCGVAEESKAQQSALARQEGGSHYQQFAIQPAEFLERNRIGFLEGCVIKRMCRWREKDGIKDLRKALHEIELLIEFNGERKE